MAVIDCRRAAQLSSMPLVVPPVCVGRRASSRGSLFKTNKRTLLCCSMHAKLPRCRHAPLQASCLFKSCLLHCAPTTDPSCHWSCRSVAVFDEQLAQAAGGYESEVGAGRGGQSCAVTCHRRGG